MIGEQGLQRAGEVRIEQLKLINSNDEVIDLSEFVVELNLYEDLFKAGSLGAIALRTLNDSVQYGIDAANDDLEVKSMEKRVKKIRSIYTRDRGKYDSDDDESVVVNVPLREAEGQERERLSPLETEWGFLQLRHMKRIDCNDEGFRGWFLRLGEFFGFRSQYRITYRKMEELLAYSIVHSDLISHVEMTRFPETLDLVDRLVFTAKSYLLNEVRLASPRDFHVAQHVLAAKILLQIRRKVLESFAKEGSLSLHSVHELDAQYITKQLIELDEFGPSKPKGSSLLDAFKLPKVRYSHQGATNKPASVRPNRVTVNKTALNE
jgi:hypothetical protein